MQYDAMMKPTNPVVTIDVKDHGTIKLQLFPDIAPNTVRNFIHLVNRGYYNGSPFHRVIEGFMIQGGSGPDTGCKIRGEFASNGFNNPLTHTRGVISMARTPDKNSATSQFFIMHRDASHLDGEYAGFGGIFDGFAVIDKIATTKTDSSDKPLTAVVMTKVTVDTKEEAYEKPDCV